MTRIEEIRARAKGATSGPWEDGACRNGDDAPVHNCVLGFRIVDGISTEIIIAEAEGCAPQDSMDMDFIAHSREDIPYLLERIKELEGKLREAKGLLMDIERDCILGQGELDRLRDWLSQAKEGSHD